MEYRVVQSAGRYGILEGYYMRNIAWNLKLALKSKALGRSYEETAEFLDMKAEELVGRRDLIVKVLSARDLNEAVAMLSGTEFFPDVEKAAASYSSTGEVRFFDLYIDRAVLSGVSKEYSLNARLYAAKSADVKGIRDIVALDVDTYNVVSVLRSKLWGMNESEAQQLVITPTGRVGASTLVSMASSESVGEALKLLESSYRFPLQGARDDEETIDLVEDGFAKILRETAALSFVWQGLSAGTVLAFIKLLEIEIGNLAAIAVGVEAGIEPKKILSKLRI